MLKVYSFEVVYYVKSLDNAITNFFTNEQLPFCRPYLVIRPKVVFFTTFDHKIGSSIKPLKVFPNSSEPGDGHFGVVLLGSESKMTIPIFICLFLSLYIVILRVIFCLYVDNES